MARILASPGEDAAVDAGTCDLSVVMPCYNEADNVERAIDEVVAHVFAIVPRAELLVVDDGSRDATAAIAREWSRRDARVRVSSQANAGHGPALVRGIREARGEHCLLIDGDCQIGLADFARTWELRQDHEAVLGVRQARSDPVHRLLLSAGLRVLIGIALGVRAADANVPYKLARREILLDAIETMPPQPLIPSVLLTVHLQRGGRRIAWQPVQHFPRSAGESTLRLRRLAAFCARALRELVAYARTAPRRDT